MDLICTVILLLAGMCFAQKGGGATNRKETSQDPGLRGGLDAGSTSVNILHYGADPTGTDDSTSAFDSAYRAAAATSGALVGDLLIPPGTYRLCGATISAGYVHIHGLAATGYSGSVNTNTVLEPTPGCTTQIMATGSPNLRNVEIDHLYFKAYKLPANGLYLDTTISWNIHDNEFNGFLNGNIALYGGGGLYVRIEGNGFSNSGRGLDLQNAYSSLHTSTYYGCNVCWINKNLFSDGGERISGIIDFGDNDIEQGPVVYPSTAGYQYWGAVDYSDSSSGTLDAHDNYFELSFGSAAVNTTSSATISTGSQTVTPASMTNIIAGMILSVDGGASQEFVQVSSVASGTFTATFARTHNSAPVSITSPMVAFNIEGSVCAMCRIVGNVIYGPSRNDPGATAINLAHQIGTSGYTYSVEMHGNQFTRWDIGAYVPGPANQTGVSVELGPNQYSLNAVNNWYEGSGTYATKVRDEAAGNPTRGSQSFSLTPQGAYLSNMALNFGIVYVSNNDTTLDLSRGNVIALVNSSATTINAVYTPNSTAAGISTAPNSEGDLFVLYATNGNTTLANSTFNLCGGANLTLTANAPLLFMVDYSGTVRQVCPSVAPVITASLMTTSATSDNVTVTNMTSSGHCSLTATNASAATNIATTYISAKATNQVTVTHMATSGMTYDVLCTAN